ncbi:hypothetical protein [Pseudomonas sp. 21_B]|uniref:hypothetical protein n=1 Tax=unclassified Pseudomonas TaxID=196821 RepID=UPI00325FB4D6
MIFKSSEKLTDPRFVGYRSLGFGRNINLATKKIELTINLSDIPEHSLKQANPRNPRLRTWKMDKDGIQHLPHWLELQRSQGIILKKHTYSREPHYQNRED